MASLPSFSVVIPAFESADTLERAVVSAARQTVAPCDIVVVDDASTDSTLALMADFQRRDARVRYIRLSRREGAQSARLRGVAESRGDWVVFLDADDELLADSIEKRMAVLAGSHGDTALIYGDTYFDACGENLFQFKRLDGHSYPWLCRELSLCPYSCMMVRKDSFARAGYPSPDFPSWQDDDMVLTIGKHYAVRHCGAPVAVMHSASGSITSSARRISEGCRMMVRKYAADIVEHHGYFRLLLWKARVVRACALAFCTDGAERGHKYLRNESAQPERCDNSRILYRWLLGHFAHGLTQYLKRHFDHIYA